MNNERSSTIRMAVRAELLRLLADEEQFTPDTLGRIRRICDASTDLIRAVESPIGASEYPPSLEEAMKHSQALFACSIDETQQGQTAPSGTPTAAAVTEAALAPLTLPAAVLPEQLPGETVAVRLLKEVITLLRDRPAPATLPSAPLQNGAVA